MRAPFSPGPRKDLTILSLIRRSGDSGHAEETAAELVAGQHHNLSSNRIPEANLRSKQLPRGQQLPRLPLHPLRNSHLPQQPTRPRGKLLPLRKTYLSGQPRQPALVHHRSLQE